MAVHVAGPDGGIVARVTAQLQAIPTTYRQVMAELRRVTWPDRQQIKEMSIGVIVLSLAIGAIIAIMDFILQQVLVVWIPRIFAGH
jgi:preprotein translocase subunit SecE